MQRLRVRITTIAPLVWEPKEVLLPGEYVIERSRDREAKGKELQGEGLAWLCSAMERQHGEQQRLGMEGLGPSS